jgi:hypothetical protein
MPTDPARQMILEYTAAGVFGIPSSKITDLIYRVALGSGDSNRTCAAALPQLYSQGQEPHSRRPQ